MTLNKDILGCPKSHMHNKLTVVAIKKGSINIHLKNNIYNLKEKDVAIINPYELHSVSKIDKNSSGLYALYLDEEWIKNLQNKLFQIKEYIPFSKNILNDVKIYNKFDFLCENLFLDNFHIKKEEYLIQFISMIMIENCSKKILKPKNILFSDIKNYIDKNIDSNLTLENISEQFLITPFHLIRIFKKELNLTPYQYILNYKINYAKKLLSKNIPISEVAITAGFNDQSHLYKYFKQIFSISPKEYKNSLTK